MLKSVGTYLFAFLSLILFFPAKALPPLEGEVFGLYPVTNEISFFKNVEDDGDDRGWTAQVIAINTFKIGTEITFEFTGDFNWDLSYKKRDYYIELSLVKPIIKPLSLNVQRILSTFEDEPVNQIGLRLSF
jgi:hypothetical protein